MSQDLRTLLHDYADGRERLSASDGGLTGIHEPVRRRAARRRLVVTGTVGLAAVAVVVGGVLGAGALPAPDTPVEPADDQQESVAPPEPEAEAQPVGPLEEWVRKRDALNDWEAVKARDLAFSERVAACMREQGFEYEPEFGPPADIAMVGFPPRLGPGPGSLEFASRYGFGVAIADPHVLSQQEVMSRWHDEFDEKRDANADTVAALGPDELLAYHVALMGDEGPYYIGAKEAPDSGLGPFEAEDRGCMGAADLADPAPWFESVEKFPTITRAVQDLPVLGLDDPRVVALEPAWAACMADAGYPGLTRRADAEALARAQMDEAKGAALRELGYETEADYMIAMGEGPMTEEGFDPIQARLKDATETIAKDGEIALAVADATCADTTGYAAVRTEVSHELQQKFVDMYTADLEAWLELWR